MSEQLHIAELNHDPNNARKHNPRNVGMLEQALKEVGAGRSIVIDENNMVLAGNATLDAAMNAGMENVRVIEASGHEIIAVRRSGLTEEQKTKLALYDNRVAELATWDTEVLETIHATEPELLQGMFFANELESMLNGPSTKEEVVSFTVKEKEPLLCPHCGKEIEQ